MRIRRHRGPVVEPVLLFIRTTSRAARGWTEQRGVPSWVEELPGGWLLLRTATVDGALAGAGLPPEQALTEWARLAPNAYLLDESALRTVRDGRVIEIDDDRDAPPWEADDPRPARGLAAIRGDRTADLVIVATTTEEPVHAVVRDGWTLVPHRHPLAAAIAFPTEDDPALALHRLGDELHLWLFADEEALGDWSWSVQGELAAIDRLPQDETGDRIRDILNPPRLGTEPFQDAGLHPTSSELAHLLGRDATAPAVVPGLVSTLGLPDAARAHLLGETDLAAAADLRTVTPAASLSGAARASAATASLQRASTRSPRLRLFGALGSLALLTLGVALSVLVVRTLDDDADVSWWHWVGAGLTLAAGISTLSTVRSWWVLRGTGRRERAELPADLPSGYGQDRLERWLNRRGPSTVIATALGILFAALGVGLWLSEVPLRDHGVHTTAQVVEFTEYSDAVIEFRTLDGRVARTTLPVADDVQIGQSVPIVYDPQDPDDVVARDDLNDPTAYLITGGAALACLVVAALLWTRRIEAKRLTGWI